MLVGWEYEGITDYPIPYGDILFQGVSYGVIECPLIVPLYGHGWLLGGTIRGQPVTPWETPPPRGVS